MQKHRKTKRRMHTEPLIDLGRAFGGREEAE